MKTVGRGDCPQSPASSACSKVGEGISSLICRLRSSNENQQILCEHHACRSVHFHRQHLWRGRFCLCLVWMRYWESASWLSKVGRNGFGACKASEDSGN